MIELLAVQIQRFGAGGDSYVHPVIAVAVVTAAVAILLSSRRNVVIPFLAGALLIPMDQVIVVGGLHFQMVRVLILFGWIRLFMLKSAGNLPLFAGGWNVVDKAVVLWASFTAIDMVLLWQDSAALTNQLGTLYTVLGIYVLIRFLIRSEEDVARALRALVWISAVIAVVMTIEQATGHNPYAYFWAGASGGRTVMERDGHFRAMGCFAHPLLAGTFGGISLPLFFALWYKRGNINKRIAIVGMMASTAIVLAANSSTPLLAYVGGLFALCLWPFRTKMRLFRWGLVITLVTLHLVMKAPVWALIGRIDLTGSSSGYHRFQLVDQFIRRFGDWWFLGTKGTETWGWDMWDLANQYVAVGETAGLLPFIFFMGIIVFGFKYIGRARQRARGDLKQEHFVWAVGAALFSNIVAFFGISYFDQTMVAWYLLLAIIGAVAASSTVRKKAEKPREQEEVVVADIPGPVLALPEFRISDLS